MMKTSEVTITVRHVGDLPEEELVEYLNGAMWNFPYEFEDWTIALNGERRK